MSILLLHLLPVAAVVGFLWLRKRLITLMATLKEVNDSLDNIQTGVNVLENAIADLKAQLADGSAVSQADLDALAQKAADINTDISNTSDQDNAFGVRSDSSVEELAERNPGASAPDPMERQRHSHSSPSSTSSPNSENNSATRTTRTHASPVSPASPEPKREPNSPPAYRQK